MQGAAASAFILLSCALFPEIALTQDSLDPMEKCFSVSDSAARLACFDSEMRRRHAAAVSKSAAPVVPAPEAPVPPPSPAAGVTTARTRAADDTVGLDGRQLILKRKAENIPSDAPEPMVVGLTRLIQQPGHQYYFELDNGQVWESTETTEDLFLGPHETVTIRPGIMGAFFLKTQEGNSIRVHRLR
jgi:hypothetical protein